MDCGPIDSEGWHGVGGVGMVLGSLTPPDGLGTPTDVKAQLQRLVDAGVDSVGLWLFPADNHADVMCRVAYEGR